MWSCGRISEGPGWRPRSKGSAHRASSDNQSSLRVCGIWQVSLTVSERTWPSVVGMGVGWLGSSGSEEGVGLRRTAQRDSGEKQVKGWGRRGAGRAPRKQ